LIGMGDDRETIALNSGKCMHDSID
jgi:hypothetical protein